MIIKDLQKCMHIINKYGSPDEAEALDKLRALTWERDNLREGSYRLLDEIVAKFMLETANKIYLQHEHNHNNEWYMVERDKSRP
ncbi:hypothetical protein EBB07_28475 [Paenibacillaceae bacterium]|nr:hypothetical protein EBB07_28475 [Paenibacillaceae bacterium]